MLLLELDLLAGELVDLPLLGPHRLDDQADLGVLGPADEADDVAQLLLDQVDLLAVLLLDADDLVLGLEPAVLVGGHAGHDLLDDRVAVFRRQRRPDALERQVELLVEHVLQVLGAHVRRVGVERPGQAREVDLQELAGVELVEHPVAVAIADRQLAGRFGLFGLVGPELEQVELDPLPPSLVGFLLVSRIVDLVRVVGDELIGREVELLLEQLEHGLVPFVVPLQEPLEDPAGEVDVPFADLVVEVLGFLHELLDVGLQEVVLLGVEILEEILAPLVGDLVVDHRAGHVTAFQQVDHGPRGLLVLVGGDGCLGSHYHRHEGQDRDQRQRT